MSAKRKLGPRERCSSREAESDYPLSRKFIKADSMEGSEIRLRGPKENKAAHLRSLMGKEGWRGDVPRKSGSTVG